MKPLGLHTYRFKDNPEEERFANAWAKEDVLPWLLHVGSQSGRPVDPSDRDELIAATVIQWLGSPVGQNFLEQLGYKRTP
jgi:hypothetical protein